MIESFRSKAWLALTLIYILLISLIVPATRTAAATGSIVLYASDGPEGTQNAVTGSGFTPGDNYTVWFATTIVGTGVTGTSGELAADFIVPTLPGGQYAITVTTASDNSNIEYFTIIPEISLDITSGRPGDRVRVTGSGFTGSSSVTILFDGSSVGNIIASTSGTFANATFTVPSGSRGKHTVTGEDGTGTSPEITFNVLQPEISLNQSSGRVGGQLSVSGSGFKPGSGVSILFDNAIIGNITSDTDGDFSRAVVTIPHSSGGTHTIGAKDTVSSAAGIAFNILSPEISLSRDSGRVDDQLSVSGSGFKSGSGVSILFDGTSIGEVVTGSTGAFSNAVVTVPPGSGGNHIITAKDSLNASPGVNFKVVQSMTVSPLSGTVGETVKFSGSGFNNGSTISVEFDAVTIKVDAVADSSGTISSGFEIPEAVAGEHTIRIQDSGGNKDSAAFIVVPELAISPETGSSGTMIKASGTGFNANQPVAVKYDGVRVATIPPVIIADSRGSFSASFEVPGSQPGSYSVEAGDTDLSASTKFTSFLSATISQLTSKSAPGHVGMQLTINGAGFLPNARIIVTRATIQEELASTRTDASGAFVVDFTMPPSPNGRHTIIVTDGISKEEFEFFLETEPPPAPSLLQPDTEKKAKQPVLFKWKDVSDPSGVTYTLQIARDEQFESVFLEEEGLEDSEFAMADGKLEPVTRDNPYYWRVKAIDGARNESKWSETRSFSAGFVLTLPNGEVDLILSAWKVYLFAGLVLLFAFLSFLLGRKTSPF